MIIVMKMGASQEEIGTVVRRVEGLGFRTHLSQGEERTIIGIIGDERPLDKDSLGRMGGVERIVPILRPFKLASRDFQANNTIFQLNGHSIGGQKIMIMAGPCAVESREQILGIAHIVRETGAHLLRGGAFRDDPTICRTALRHRDSPDVRWNRFGFRVASVWSGPGRSQLCAPLHLYPVGPAEGRVCASEKGPGALTLRYPAVRWANIIAAAFWIVFNLAGLPYPGAYDNFLIIVIIVFNALTVWNAWRWVI